MKRIQFSIFMLCVIYPVVFMSGMIICFTKSKNPDNKECVVLQHFSQTSIANTQKCFVMPTIPDSLQYTKDRTAYLVTHYWDNFDFADTTYIHLPEVTEQAFANYIQALPHTQKQTADASIKTLLAKTMEEQTGEMYPYFCQLFKKYLYEPNSPMCNKELYTSVLQYIISDKITPIAYNEEYLNK